MKNAVKIMVLILAVALMIFPYAAILLAGLTGEVMNQIDYHMNMHLDFGSIMVIALVGLYAVIVLANIVFVIIWSVIGGDSEWVLFWNLMIRCGYLLVWGFMGLFFVAGLIVWYIGGKETVAQVCGMGALLLMTPGVYGICGNILAVRERYVGTGLAVAMSILQFIPGIDLITAIISYCIVNTRRKKRQNQQLGTNRV
ncbi:MAG: hypothetical protein PUJ55_11990 [Clostridiales bacterium]|nr:hypothetical protein [Roseburia sp.]MDD7637642.1 hypothetical protein [Clostridiales bacterium]MDY4113142.1 hypothetical protein [Roseburia sp.]